MKKPCGEKKESKNSSVADFIFGAKVMFFVIGRSVYFFLLIPLTNQVLVM